MLQYIIELYYRWCNKDDEEEDDRDFFHCPDVVDYGCEIDHKSNGYTVRLWIETDKAVLFPFIHNNRLTWSRRGENPHGYLCDNGKDKVYVSYHAAKCEGMDILDFALESIQEGDPISLDVTQPKCVLWRL